MKQSWKCPKCDGAKIGYLEKVLDEIGPTQHPVRRSVGEVPVGRFGGGENVGHFEAFVCTECGYFEEYVRDPAAVNWDAVKGFRWCKT